MIWDMHGTIPPETQEAKMSETPELKPCPFCGSTDLDSGGDDKFVGYWCKNCQAMGPNHYGRHDWNTRPLYDGQAKVIEAAKAWNAARTIFNQCDEEETWSHLTALEEAERGLGEALAALDRQCPVCGGWVYVGDACCPKCSPEALAALQESTND